MITCPYCHEVFDESYYRNQHVPCPNPVGDCTPSWARSAEAADRWLAGFNDSPERCACQYGHIECSYPAGGGACMNEVWFYSSEGVEAQAEHDAHMRQQHDGEMREMRDDPRVVQQPDVDRSRR